MIKPDDIYQKNWKNVTETIAQVQAKVAVVGTKN
jgi:hypothetical protein